MKITLETPASELVQKHLNRNPRVIGYESSPFGPVFDVEIEIGKPVPMAIAAEARSLHLDPRISRTPHS